MTGCFPSGCPERSWRWLAGVHGLADRAKQLNLFQEEEIPWQRNQSFR
jgi:hypothetical protein